MINETTADFLRWAGEVLPSTQQAMLIKLREEVEEFFADPSGEEAADVVFVLCRWCEAMGIDLADFLDYKFSIVQTRQWYQTPDGSWKHRKIVNSVVS